jgi:hypothetical protein
VFSDQKIRAILFYLSVSVFFSGLPFILSFALGYKFDSHTFKFTKTGLISIKTQPQGAQVYLNSRLLNDKSPTSINELLPGSYNIRLELDEHYPWEAEVNVEPRKVTRIEKVILFPIRTNITQLNQGSVSSFFVDQGKGNIYYFYQRSIYQSDLEGRRFEEVAVLPEEFIHPVKDLKISADNEKLVVFNKYQVCIVYLNSRRFAGSYRPPVVLNYHNQQMLDVFWHSDNYHLLLVTDKNIAVLEADSRSSQINMVSLNSKPGKLFYDTDKDTLYFPDRQKGPDGAIYENIYKLDLNNKTSILSNIKNSKQDEK